MDYPFKLKQHVNGPTDINGNMLGLVINDEDFVRNVTITDMISDLAIVDIKCAINKPEKRHILEIWCD